MSTLIIWQTDDYRPSRGALLPARIKADDPLTLQRGCGWAATSTAGGDW
jgi:hypothetical protein